MSDERQVVEYKPFGSETTIRLSPGIVRKYLVSGGAQVTDQEVMMFLMLCRNAGLDPFRREAYLIKYSDRESATIVTGKDAFTKRAEAHPDHEGMQAGVIVERDGEVIERMGSLVLSGDKLVGGWAKVYKRGRQVPYYTTVAYDEYEGRKHDGTPNRQWKEKPATMIRKVALVQALREAYPDALGGMYDSAEMSHIDAAELPEKDVTPESDTDRIASQDWPPNSDTIDVTSDDEPVLPDEQPLSDRAQQELDTEIF
jgi:phage recombination protein Bet